MAKEFISPEAEKALTGTERLVSLAREAMASKIEAALGTADEGKKNVVGAGGSPEELAQAEEAGRELVAGTRALAEQVENELATLSAPERPVVNEPETVVPEPVKAKDAAVLLSEKPNIVPAEFIDIPRPTMPGEPPQRNAVPEQAVPAEHPKSPEEKIEAAREAYVAAYAEWKAVPKSDEVNRAFREGEAEALFKEYRETVDAEASGAYEAKRKEFEGLGQSPEVIDANLKEFFSRELFQKYIVGEHAALNQAKAESWPPKERGLFMRGLEWWTKKVPKSVRYAIAAGVMTGVAVGTGAVAVGTGALVFAGYRFGRIALSGAVTVGAERGIAAGIKGWEKTFGKEKTREHRIEELAKRTDIAGDMSAMSAEYERIVEETARRERRQNTAKWVGAALVGGSSMVWGGVLDRALGFSKPSLPLETKPSAPVGAAVELDPRSGLSRALNPLESPQDAIKPPLAPPGPAEPLMTAHAAERAQEAFETAQKESIARIEELATIRKGEGISNAVYRQLEERLNSGAPKFGLTAEQIESAGKVKHALASGEKITMQVIEKTPEKFGLTPADIENAARVKGVLTRQTVHLMEENGMIHYAKDAAGRLHIDAEERIGNIGGKVYLEEGDVIRIGNGTRVYTLPEELTELGRVNAAEVHGLPADVEGLHKPHIPDVSHLEGIKPSFVFGAAALENGSVAESVAAPEIVERLSRDAEILDRVHETFSTQSLMEQESYLKTIDQLVGSNVAALKGVPGAVAEHHELMEKVQSDLADLHGIYDKTLKRFWVMVEDTGVTKQAYEHAIVRSNVRVGELIQWTTEHPDQYDERFVALKDTVTKFRPQPNELGLTVDHFLRSKVVLKAVSHTSF